MPRIERVSRGSMTPSSYNIPERKNGSDCSSTWASTICLIPAKPSASNTSPFDSADCFATISRTPASCAGPMTADLAEGQVKRKRGS